MQYYKTGHFPLACIEVDNSETLCWSGRWAALLRGNRGQCWAALCSCEHTLAGEACCMCWTRVSGDTVLRTRLSVRWSQGAASPILGWSKTCRDTALIDYCLYCFLFFLLQVIKCQALLSELLSAGGLLGTAFGDILSIAGIFWGLKYPIHSTKFIKQFTHLKAIFHHH